MAEPLFLVRTDARFGRLRGEIVRTPEHVEQAFARHKRARWIGRPSVLGSLLARAPEPCSTWHKLLLLDEPTTGGREMLGAFFRVVLAPGQGVRFLPDAELIEVLGAPNPDEYFIGGVVDREDAVLVLFRGNFDRLVVPLSWFTASGDGTRPDTKRFQVTDCGQTVRLGAYEASTEAVLFDFDDKVRARMKARLVEGDGSFGGALRRLRIHRSVSQTDFPTLSAKTIARIERGQVRKPHAKTLAILARRLGVKPGQIETW